MKKIKAEVHCPNSVNHEVCCIDMSAMNNKLMLAVFHCIQCSNSFVIGIDENLKARLVEFVDDVYSQKKIKVENVIKDLSNPGKNPAKW